MYMFVFFSHTKHPLATGISDYLDENLTSCFIMPLYKLLEMKRVTDGHCFYNKFFMHEFLTCLQLVNSNLPLHY